MARFYDQLDTFLRQFIGEQKVFFTASAPAAGRINLSPKGMDTLRIIDDRTVGYLDLTGSGNETAAHILENGRMTIMFCSFTEKPLIVRLYGRGEIIATRDPRFDDLAGFFPAYPARRQIILLHIESAQSSCGFGVPLMTCEAERPTLAEYWSQKSELEIDAYQEKKNTISIDGLPTAPKSN